MLFRSVKFIAEENKKYTGKIYATYDLDTNQLNDITGEQNKQIDKEMLTQEIKLTTEYNLKIENIKVRKENSQNEETVYTKGEKVIVEFESNNGTQYEPQKVTINGEEYNITKNNNKYTVELNNIEGIGQKEIKVETIKLSPKTPYPILPPPAH